MITRDDHGRALQTYPTCRHHLSMTLKTFAPFQYVMKSPRVVHNHPSGDTTPSRADIEMTKEIVEAGKRLGIAVHDHLIIGRKGYSSMKGLLLI